MHHFLYFWRIATIGFSFRASHQERLGKLDLCQLKSACIQIGCFPLRFSPLLFWLRLQFLFDLSLDQTSSQLFQKDQKALRNLPILDQGTLDEDIFGFQLDLGVFAVDDGRQGQDHSLAVVDHWIHRAVADDRQIGPQEKKEVTETVKRLRFGIETFPQKLPVLPVLRWL